MEPNTLNEISDSVLNFIAQEIERRLAVQLKAWGTLDYAKEIVELKQKLNSQLEYIHSLEAQLAKIDANNRPG